VLAGSSVLYPKISPEIVIEAAPEVILDATHTDDPAAALRRLECAGPRCRR
jgi:hypothetical protein